MLELIISLSLHVGMGDDYNSIHPQIRWNQDDYITGVYLNSHSELSAFVGHRWESGDWGVELGLVTGYNIAPVVPFVKGNYKNFWVAPAIHEEKLGAVVGIEWKF
jgi:hypothetical protein